MSEIDHRAQLEKTEIKRSWKRRLTSIVIRLDRNVITKASNLDVTPINYEQIMSHQLQCGTDRVNKMNPKYFIR